MPGTYHVSPQAVAESVCDLVAHGFRFTANVFGPRGSGKTTALAAIIQDMEPHHVAAFAPWPAIARLRALAPNLKFDLSGQPLDALHRYSALPGADRYPHHEPIADSYIAEVLAIINDLHEPPTEMEQRFLESLKPQVLAALQVDQQARLDAEPQPRNAYLNAVAEYAETYKARRHLRDKADLIAGDYYVCRPIKLLILDDVEPQDAQVLPHFFPNASLVTASLHQQDADVAFHLPVCLRSPERVEIEGGLVSSIPPPADFTSLFVIAPPWQRKSWLSWLQHYGLPAPFCLSHWTADHAGAVLARYNRLTDLPVVRLGSAAAMRGLEAEIVIADREACYNSEMAEIALSRASRALVIFQR